MNFTYVASGSVTLGGCSVYRASEYLYFAFGIGSIVYSKAKAAKGIYEKVVIKKVHFPNSHIDPTTNLLICINCNLAPLYTDTFNALWNEGDLVSFSQARILVDNYFVLQDSIAQQNALKCQ